MISIEHVAKQLQIPQNQLLEECLKSYLRQRLIMIESRIFTIAKKHGVKNVLDLDRNISKGLVSESDSYEDFFALDHLESEKEKIEYLLRSI